MFPLAFVILGIPVVLSGFAFFKARAFRALNSLGYAVVLCSSVFLLRRILLDGPLSWQGVLYMDILSAFFLLVISIVAFAASLYSIGYLRRDVLEKVVSPRKESLYYVLFNFFCLSMFLVPMLNNLGYLWVAIEMTTLVSAFLVGFYNRKESVEAAWKYIILCSVGIIFALLGTILFSYAYSLTGVSKSISWTDLMAASPGLPANIVKVAFIFILVGYGTKAGLAPMHTWLPDAHSQAVAPISALLSGVLLKTALYAILRFGMIEIRTVGLSTFSHLLIFFGMISLVVSSGFILVQKDLKRLLAYSSIEHMGIIALSFGLATPLGFAAGLFHIFNHAVNKAFMFFGAGNIVHAYKKHNMNAIKGVIRLMPFTGIMVLLGVFALTGFPPFSIFASEILILIAAFAKGSYVIGSCLLLFLGIVFGAFIFHFGKMLYGHKPKDMVCEGEPASGKLAFVFLLILMLSGGIGFVFVQEDVLWIVRAFFQI